VKNNNRSALFFCVDTLVALLPLTFVAAWYYGARVLLTCAISVMAALAVKAAVWLIKGARPTGGDLYCVCGALAIALFCPAAAPYWLPALGAALMVVLREAGLAALKRDCFCAAAAALCALFLINGGAMSHYTPPGDRLPFFGSITAAREPSILQLLEAGRLPESDPLTLLLGRYAGPMGTTVLAVLLLCAGYLFIRRPRSLLTALPYMATLAACSLIFVRAGSPLDSALYETVGGSALFCVIFVAAQPGSVPSNGAARALLGVAMGLITALLRQLGLCESGCLYALLLSSIFAEPAERLGRRLTEHKREVQ
jgi:electron transport complex protein RnfD